MSIPHNTTHDTTPSSTVPALDDFSKIHTNSVLASLFDRVQAQQSEIESQNLYVKDLESQLGATNSSLATLKSAFDSNSLDFAHASLNSILARPIPGADPRSVTSGDDSASSSPNDHFLQSGSPRDHYLLDKELTKSQNANKAFQKPYERLEKSSLQLRKVIFPRKSLCMLKRWIQKSSSSRRLSIL